MNTKPKWDPVAVARARLANNGRNAANKYMGIRTSSDLHVCEGLLKIVDKYTAARDAFLSMLADGKWSIDYDADTNDAGRMIDCSTFEITGRFDSLAELCKAFGIEPASYDSSLDDAITKAIEEPVPATRP